MTSLILGTLLLQTQAKKDVIVPAAPIGTNSSFQMGVKDAAQLLQNGKFAEATTRLKNLPNKEFAVNFKFKGISKASQEIFEMAAKRAIEDWQAAVPQLKIRIDKDPRVVIEVVTHFSELGSKDEKSLTLFSSPDPSDPATEAVLALNRTSKNVEISTDNMANEVRYILGQYLGVEGIPDPSSAMFRVEGLNRIYVPIDIKSIQLVRKTLEQSNQLREWAKSKTKVKAEFGEAFLPENVVDLGTITQGEPQAFQFEVRNRGKGDLHFAVKPDCSCFLINYNPTVPGGEVGIVTVQMSTIDFQGSHDKGLYVYTDDAENAVTRVSIKSMIRPAYRLMREGDQSSTLVMTPQGLSLKYFLFADNELPFEPRKATVSGVSAVASISEWEGDVEDPEWFKGKQHRKGYQISVLISPSAANGKNLVALLIQTDSKQFPVLGSNFYVQKGVALNPSSIFYGDVTSELVRATCYLDLPTQSTEVISAKASDPRFTPKLERVSDTQYRLTVDFRKSKETGTIFASVSVKTNDPDSPEIIIPIQAYVP
ncbi:MAG: DUF1573 domain-containing protein [Fimbriimonadaceae bacterium]